MDTGVNDLTCDTPLAIMVIRTAEASKKNIRGEGPILVAKATNSGLSLFPRRRPRRLRTMDMMRRPRTVAVDSPPAVGLRWARSNIKNQCARESPGISLRLFLITVSCTRKE